MEPKQLPCGAVLKIGALLQGGADFFLNNHVKEKSGSTFQGGTISQNGSLEEP